MVREGKWPISPGTLEPSLPKGKEGAVMPLRLWRHPSRSRAQLLGAIGGVMETPGAGAEHSPAQAGLPAPPAGASMRRLMEWKLSRAACPSAWLGRAGGGR